MWGENQRARFRDAKTDQKFFLQGNKWEVVVMVGCIQICAFFGVRQREGLDYVMGHGTWKGQLHVGEGVEATCALWLAKVPLLVHP